ncbi:endoplasmic reticulum junction formation protein lunapark-B isoform X3 [Pimephales promelas]|uniref:endoplasmic reticulum junction formation protein lunapark-B isoform X3 n=1 Tax=Pimephales promelas TaxID=90988 RepID=UPI001955D2D8|nr:endoplasmic reticulum junction formation protein lunapark-B isoform X3 [Pimephales promelas]KAG1942388.1 endoplasmic reticulum junction formation protein lunapark [Pimephales promelas]KAG1942389.1 endoplasmic reticulum junction formation protein lunapark [Pimephales promelas]KAG1942391.1 endoplasmic reticulum junction formation protein lunapark [Pimephales promelas]
MGAIISRWKTKTSTVDILESLDKDINDLEEFRTKNQRLLKLWVGRLLFYSSALYLITCLCVYYLYFPEQWSARIITALPLLAFPALVLLLRKLLIFLFSKRTERNNEKLDDLKTKKRKILEEVMETETYKNAKLILERFDPESKKKAEAEATPVRPHMTTRPGQDLRQRHVAMATPGPGPMTPGATPHRTAPGGPPEKGLGGSPAESPQQMMRRNMNPYSPGPGSGMHPPGPPLARPILPRERSSVDRVIEYLVGDGPQNRYALICHQCFSHNGMALKEEFEYVAFRCAYCYFMNPARKTRPQAPRLPEFSFERRLRSESPETQSSAATETPEDSDVPEDDVERTTSADPQDPTAEGPPVEHETEAEVSQPRRSPSPSKDVPQEEAVAQGEQQKEDESN